MVPRKRLGTWFGFGFGLATLTLTLTLTLTRKRLGTPQSAAAPSSASTMNSLRNATNTCAQVR